MLISQLAPHVAIVFARYMLQVLKEKVKDLKGLLKSLIAYKKIEAHSR